MLHAFLLLAQADPGQGVESTAPAWGMFVPIIVIFALMYFLLILPERRRERRHREELNSKLKKNDRVVTRSGIIGVVANIKDNEVVLRIDESSNARLTVLKASIDSILNAEDQTKDASAKSDAIKAGAPPAK